MLQNLTKKSGWNMPTIILALSMFVTGASGIIMQQLLAVSASNILGSSQKQYALTISLMLGGMGIGGWMQKLITKNLLVAFVGIELALALLTAYSPIGLYATYTILPDYVTFVQCTDISLVGLLIGFEIPIISRINQEFQPELKDNLASITAMDYIGSMVGGGAWIFMLGKTSMSSMAIYTASANLIVASLTFFYFRNTSKSSGKLATWITTATVCVIILFGGVNNNKWQVDLEQKLYESPIIFHKTTKYQELVCTYDKELEEYRLYINGNLQFSSLDEKIYHEELVHPAMSIAMSHHNVLILGGGDGLALREVLKYNDVKSVELVDLDPDMIKLFTDNDTFAKLNHYAFKDARVHITIPKLEKIGVRPVTVEDDDTFVTTGMVNVYNVDAFNFVQESDHKLYDIVIVDFPDPSMVEVAKLYSMEFYAHLRQKLAPGGIITVQSTSPFHAKEAYLCINRTLQAAGYNTLPYHYNIPSFGDWGWIMAVNKNSHIDLKSKIASIEHFSIPTSEVSTDLVKASTIFTKDALVSTHTDISTVLDPTLITHYNDESWGVE